MAKSNFFEIQSRKSKPFLNHKDKIVIEFNHTYPAGMGSEVIGMPVNSSRPNQIDRRMLKNPENMTNYSPAGLIRKRPMGQVAGLAVIAFFLFIGRPFAQTASLTPTPVPPPSSPGVKTNSIPQTQTASEASTVQDTESPASELKKLSLEQLMDLDVTSVAKQPQPYLQAPAAIDVITNDEIRRSGAFDIPEALRLADNLDVAQISSAGWQISARGFNSSVSNKLLVLMDGRSIYTPLFAGVIWGNQDYLMADLDRIEVISGPGGTLWGANAVNGVINIISKSAKDTQGAYVEGGGGTQPQDFVAARYGGTLAPNVYYRVYGKYFNEGPEVYSDGTSAQDSWNKGQGGFRIDQEDSSPDRFTLQGDIYGGNSQSTPGGEGSPNYQGISTGGNLLARWTRTFADDDDLSLQAYYDRTNMVVPFQASAAFSAPAGPLFDDLDTIDLDFQDRFALDAGNHLVWGLGYRFTNDEVVDAPVVAFTPNTLDLNLFSGFIQDEIKFGGDIALTLGSKVEHNDYTGYEFEPSGRIRWDLTDKQMLWAAVSRAVRMPARYDRDLLEPSPAYGTFLGNNSTFQSETVIAYELGYRAELDSRFSTSISTFFNNYSDLRSLDFTPITLVPLFFSNDLRAQTYGVEFTADYQLSEGWRLHSGYDLIQETIWIAPGQVDLSNGLAETADPLNQVFLRSSMDLPGQVELDADFRWIDSVKNGGIGATAPQMIPSYAELDLRLGWRVTRDIEISLAGQNLLQDQHLEGGTPGSGQEEIQRSGYGKITCQF